MLDGSAQRMLDAAAVEDRDRLKFIERDGQLPAALLRDAAGKREDFLREP